MTTIDMVNTIAEIFMLVFPSFFILKAVEAAQTTKKRFDIGYFFFWSGLTIWIYPVFLVMISKA